MKVAIINSSGEYVRMFISMGYSIARNIEEADLICFTGGSDVSPNLYGAKKHQNTFNSPERDASERAVFNAYVFEKPMVGICRGGQFLNVMCGGQMYQHVTKHTNPHNITDLQTGETVYASSTHHQMMKPSPKALLVASSANGGTREWYDGEVFHRDVSKEDIEVVFYEEQQCLCFQPHPEFGSVELEGLKRYFFGLLEFYFQELKVA